ncbi:MAG: hypothetical protein IKR38_05080 [Bacteroidales bacterium]|nr:hypothetical protein [Bacteroidales bacterium]
MKLWKLILPVLSLAACTRNPALREAARLVESYPDSALTILEGVSPKDLSTRDKAEYDYLGALAFYNTYFFLDDAHSEALASAYRFKEQQRGRTANLALLVAAILATLVLYFWARRAQTEKQLLIQKEENELLLSAAEELRSRMGALVKSEKKQGNTFDALDRLCEQYYIYEGTENLQPRIIREVRSIVEGLRSDSSVQKNLEQSLNSKYPGVMTRLRTEFPKWKDEDYLLYLFSASGFSSTTISTLMEKEKPYIYNRIYRLKERIKNSDTTDKDLFLSLL